MLLNITDIRDWFKDNENVKDMTWLGYTKSCVKVPEFDKLSGMKNLEKIVFPSTTRELVNGFTFEAVDEAKLKIVIVLQGDGNIAFSPIGSMCEYCTNIELIDLPERQWRSGRTCFNYWGFRGSAKPNVVVRSSTCAQPSGSYGLGDIIKNLFVPITLVEEYKTKFDTYMKLSGGRIYAIGGDEWAAEFGSHDEWASYRKYGLDEFIGM